MQGRRFEEQVYDLPATFSKNTYRDRRKGRKSKPCVIAIHTEMLDYVKARRGESLPETFLFANPRTWGAYSREATLSPWSRMRKAEGIGESSKLCGASRHSFVSQQINLNISSSKVSRLTGHGNPRMIDQRYAHHDLESLRTDLSLVSPKKRETVTRLSPGKKGQCEIG